MANQISIAVDDTATADAIQRALTSGGIRVNRLSGAKATQFGMTFSTAKGSLKVSSSEIIQLVSATPDVVDVLFSTLERFRHRVKLFVNGQPKELSRTGRLVRKTFEQFIRGE